MAEKVFILGSDSFPDRFVLGEGEKLSATFVAPFGVSGDFNVAFDLAGKGAELDIAGLYLCSGEQKVTFKLNVNHLTGGCKSHQLFKGLAEGESRVSFEGLVYVAKDAQKTEALQENHSLLLSDKAQVTSQPQLEIYADDVVCSHGATIGSLNEDEQFYMRSRGIDREEARRLQIVSFLSPVLSRIPNYFVSLQSALEKGDY